MMKSVSSGEAASVSEREIAVVAYRLWEAAGRPEGCAVEHWLEAEARLLNGEDSKEAQASSVIREGPGDRQVRRARYGLVLRS